MSSVMSISTQTDRGPALAPPRGAAVAGVIFAVLTIVGLGLVRFAIPTDLSVPGNWVVEPERRSAVLYALDLVPFAGIAFLWFIGVLRNRLGELEDRFFATVFLGSGLLFIASLYSTAAAMDALVESARGGNIDSQTYFFGRCLCDGLLNLFAMKMAGVFMFSTSTVGLRTEVFSRWVAYIGFACAAMLVLVIANWRWITLVFPIWILLVSTNILLADYRSRQVARA